MTVQADRTRSIPVPEQLRLRLPGLEAALDVETAAAVIERELLGGGADTVIVGLSVGTIWVGEDTCTLRYRVRVRSPVADGDSEQVVLGQVSSSGLALRPFPHDPGLPTLPQALDRETVRRTLAAAGLHLRNAQVTVVHHPRQGACVLRYDVDGSQLFAKVYGDDATGSSVAAVQSRLRNLSASVRFPTVLTYDPSLRLLVMEAVPGVHLTQPAGAGAAGHALAHLHGQDVAGAPTRTLAEDLADLDRALTVIARFRPGVADLLRQAISEAVADAADAPAGVLTHGDYTPSQLLWDGTAVGVVDLDDMCVADPARDLGRFIAAFALRSSRQIGMSYASAQVSELTASLVEAYLEARPPGQPDHTLLRRVAVHRALSLARSAARSCRQLKEDRLAAALTLLSVEADQATSADPA
jgi:aminoglycoside phosphotransferase